MSRVLRRAEFRDTYNRGTRLTSRFFVAFCLCTGNTQQPVRFGFTTPRALGKAVVRNRIKRRIREAVRQELAAFPDNWIIVINPRRSTLTAGFTDLRCELRRVLEKCK
ncbi:MAG: ribonuclease P protein component [Bryobacteraceae bacterium]